ncbi:hypothetical protein [Acetobacter pasteurianus]|uniref:hypothetical protein n=1 Tax=Acetobacter pasteurianus TaxID=438 RepID=UPI000460CEBA|nr:hypothetical protein [Acetobacter pasteurianus]KDE19275.1 hypothetical protein AZ09_13360 [Acetobacter aceti 1023]
MAILPGLLKSQSKNQDKEPEITHKSTQSKVFRTLHFFSKSIFSMSNQFLVKQDPHLLAHEALLQIRDALLPALQGVRDGKNHHVDGIILLTEGLVKDLDAACDALDAASRS